MQLRPEDVQDIVHLLDSLPYDEFEVRTGTLRVALRRAGTAGWTQETQVLSAPNLVEADAANAATEPAVEQTPNNQSHTRQAPTDPAPGPTVRRAADHDPVPPGLVGVKAPLPGTFYRAPKPGAAPYVDVGSRVDEDTVIGLIETMKLFNSVYANTRGVVEEFRVSDAEFADKDAALVLVRPDEAERDG